MFGDAFGGKSEALPSVPKDNEITLDCTLYELYNAALKQIEFDRDLICHDGKTTRKHRESLQVEVKPGASEQDVMIHSDKGNEAYGHQASVLKIKVK